MTPRVVVCTGCGQERWDGLGACGRCGAYTDFAIAEELARQRRLREYVAEHSMDVRVVVPEVRE